MGKPWPLYRPAGRFSQQDFQLDLAAGHAPCPAGQRIAIPPGKTARFPAHVCTPCPLREQWTTCRRGGRTLHLHPQEHLLQRLRE